MSTLYDIYYNIQTHVKKALESHFIYSYNKSQEDALFLNFILVKNSTCFGQT
jgi:hypothetical protein